MRMIDADALKAEIQRRRKRYKTLTGVDMAMLIDDAPTVGGWISVKDRLPERSGDVLVCCGEHYMNVFSYSWRHKAFNAFDDLPTSENRIESVTHWMPLPEPPEEDEA